MSNLKLVVGATTRRLVPRSAVTAAGAREATNSNDILDRFFKTGDYDKRLGMGARARQAYARVMPAALPRPV